MNSNLKNLRFEHIKGYQHRIVLEDDTSIQKKAYPVSEKEEEEFKEKSKIWLENDMIDTSNSFFCKSSIRYFEKEQANAHSDRQHRFE